MKIWRAFLLVAVGCAVGWFPSSSDAGPLGIFGRKKATCTKENCPIHSPTGTGQLKINSKGGFTGQLPDSYYADYFAKKTGTTEPAPDVPEATEALAVDTALANVANLEAAIAEAREDVERAITAEQQASERRALELRQQIDKMTTEFQAEIAELTAQLQSLTPTPEE